jgi:hypothetical protein
VRCGDASGEAKALEEAFTSLDIADKLRWCMRKVVKLCDKPSSDVTMEALSPILSGVGCIWFAMSRRHPLKSFVVVNESDGGAKQNSWGGDDRCELLRLLHLTAQDALSAIAYNIFSEPR